LFPPHIHKQSVGFCHQLIRGGTAHCLRGNRCCVWQGPKLSKKSYNTRGL
jgi:hypothetical protein